MAAWLRCSDANRMSRAGSFCDSEPEQPSGGAAQDQLIGIRALWTTDFGHSVTSSSCYRTFCAICGVLQCLVQRWFFVAGGCVWASHPSYLMQRWSLQSSCSERVPGESSSCQPQNLQALEYFRVEEWMDFSHWFSTPLSYVHGISYTLVPIPQKRMHWMIEQQNDSEWSKVKVWELDTDCVHPCVV